MKNVCHFPIAFILCMSLIMGCTRPRTPEGLQVKISENDPFKNEMVSSEYFELDTQEDHVIEGSKGTVIVIPKGCFIDASGHAVTGKVQVELAEALSVEDMIVSNLTTTSAGELLETDGMIYFQVRHQGKPVFVNPKTPVYMEIPTQNKKSGMMIYEGERDAQGNMDWRNPMKLESYLQPIAMEQLDFYPNGLEAVVRQALPYKRHTEVSPALLDSLYLAMKYIDLYRIWRGTHATDLNEPYDNGIKIVVDGEYSSESYEYGEAAAPTEEVSDTKEWVEGCGIDPSLVQAIHCKEFEGTWIATKEFEKRLQSIFKTYNEEVLKVYLDNLDKNLWECDALAADLIPEDSLANVFRANAEMKCTRLKESNTHLELLQAFYQKRWAKTNKKLKKLAKEANQLRDKENEKFKKVAEKYKKLLFKREKHRMETYGFEWTKTGWANVDRGTIPKQWGRKSLEVHVVDGKSYDRVYTYVMYKNIQSLYRLNTTDYELFHVGNATERSMLMPNNKQAVLVSIGYGKEKPFVAIQEFNTSETSITLSLEASSPKALKERIKLYNKWGSANSITKDLLFQKLRFKEKNRQMKLWMELVFLVKVFNVVHENCPVTFDGEISDAW